jgi:hypothetical protein
MLSKLQALFAVALAAAAIGTEPPRVTPLECIPREQCCKVCHKGRACGNTCIRADYDCHKGQGCACNAEDICE